MAQFPAVIALDELGEKQGREIYLGTSAGDVNGDGFDDSISGNGSASIEGWADYSGHGATFLVFGRPGGFDNSTEGRFRFEGVSEGHRSGSSVASAGDFNGDGFDDIIIGAPGTRTNGSDTGSAYVVFGNADGFAPRQSLGFIDGTNGFRFDGAAALDRTGSSVASAGDLNRDGFDDIVIGAPGADPNGDGSGSSYVVFGKAGGVGLRLLPSDLDGRNGFHLDGGPAGDGSGSSVASAGDVNGDGLPDLFIAAENVFERPSDSPSPTGYIVFGRAGGFGAKVDLTTLDGSNGFKITGTLAGTPNATRPTPAGDVNGDGLDDLVIGVPGADPNGVDGAGSTYVVFGRKGGFSTTLDPSKLAATEGFRIDGTIEGGGSGFSVAAAGDVNADGFADLIVNERGRYVSGLGYEGQGYVVFGRAGGYPSNIKLSDLDGTNGFRVDSGQTSFPYEVLWSTFVSPSVDANGDGIDDIVATVTRDRPSDDYTQVSKFVIYGQAAGTAGTRTGTAAGETLAGGGLDDILLGRGGDDILRGLGGDDRLFGNGGDDLLDGGTGIDRLKGGAGDDLYAVDNARDAVFEVAGQGNDTVVATVSYALRAGQEIETLQLSPATGKASLNLTGNEYANTLRGNGGANILDGGGGADRLIGGAGDDTYRVDSGADIVVEAAGQGNDTILTSVSYALARGQEIETLQLARLSYDNPFNLWGNELAQTLIGNGGANLLEGRGGADVMQGLAGDDIYGVENAGDRVIEAVGGGNDEVRASTSYTLTAGQEIESLRLPSASTDAFNLGGNEFNNRLTGNKGNNVLNGGGGADFMTGARGDDTYAVDNAGDRVFETWGEGNDTVVATVSYKLMFDVIETLQLSSATGSANLNLTGNFYANTLRGNGGANVLDGGEGIDQLYGKSGNDTYAVDRAEDRVFEAVGQGNDTVVATVSYALQAGQEIETLQLSSATAGRPLKLTGNELANTLRGNDADNQLNGAGGADVLVGRGGADTFVFSTALGADNVDRITDFSGDDTIRLVKSVFGALAPGALSASAFKDLGAAGATLDADDRILYDSRTGSLSYDADGSGKAAAVAFAVLDNKAALTHADFFVL